MVTRLEIAYELFLSGLSITKSAENAKVGERTLSNFLKSKGIDTRRNSRKHIFDEDFFESIDTEEKAYWLGFIYADGCVRENQGKSKNKGMALEISLKASDKNHLKKFTNLLGLNEEIIKDKNIKLNGKTYPSVKIVLGSTKMAKDLIRIGATQRKSLTLEFPSKDILGEYHNHFLRGYFDGDGNIGLRNTQRYRNCPRITLLGTEEFLNEVKSFCEDALSITNVKLQKKNNSKALTYQKTGNDARKILEYMYGGASVYLDRKYEVYKQILPS